FFFSSRRRHTRSYGDWSSDCALPIFSSTGGQIIAAGPNPANIEVITGSKVTGGNTTTPTLNLGIVHSGDSTTYQIANQGTAANRSEERRVGKECRGGCAPEHEGGKE